IVLAAPLQGNAVESVQVGTPGFKSQIVVEPRANPNQVVVSVLDPTGNPILGLQPQDFVLGQDIHKARILSAEPMASTQALPVNLVLVIDNSFSMYERQAIQPLLAALDELLKDVRPIDNIHAVVFSDAETRAVGGRTLNVRTFRSNTFSELKAFFASAFDRGITTKTYLNEAILAGLDIAKAMPANEQKLMVVFSDGEDLNSKYRIPEVTLEAGRIAKLGIYCIDYMPREQTDEFLAGLAGTHGGRTWKARSAAELVPIFQSFKSTILRRYVLTYELLNPVALEPNTLNFEVLATTTGAAASHMVFFFTGRSAIPDRYALFEDGAQTDAFEPASLSGALNRYLNILNIVGHGLRHDPAAQVDIVGCTSETGVEQGELALSQRRAETVKDYLQKIWGIAADRMLIEARHLPGAPSDSESPAGRLENQRVEIRVEPAAARSRIVGSLVAETRHRNEVSVNLDLFPLPDISAWELVIQGEDRPLKTVQGTGDVPPAFQIPLDELGRDRLARLSAIEAVIRVTDAKGRVHEVASDLCHIRTSDKELMKDIAFPPSGAVDLAPDTVTVEEITIVDSAPLLNYVYFDTGRADIPNRYVRNSPAEPRTFDERALKGTLEKHHQVLNIIGRRTADRPRARLRITGCNSNWGEEKGKTELSRRRAEAVRTYLQAAWGIEPARMAVDARDLPAVASASNIPEGRAENQRVEITSDDPAILDTVQSTFIEAVSDTDRFRITPQIETGLGLKDWRIEMVGDGKPLETLTGTGALDSSYVLALKDLGLLNIGNYQTITAAVDVTDAKGQTFRTEDSTHVRFIRREERLAQKEGYKVIEKYALILFDFDRAEIKDRNRAVLDRISARMREVPAAIVTIIGHTDSIGKLDYNVALSKKRAQAAYDLILGGGIRAHDGIRHDGRGPADPLFDNGLPEGRAFNRTVTVSLEYEQMKSFSPAIVKESP
ncbi:MAG: OmpA family protein, partial [Vicinamibacterales bacterium]|nr:OmpA family protein [Vicinamibacterales bacterium]